MRLESASRPRLVIASCTEEDMPTIAADHAAALAKLDNVRQSCEKTLSSLDNSVDTAAQTLAEIRGTLDRWDRMKKKFGDAIDAFAQRYADAMREERTPLTVEGPPTGATAHGFDFR